MQNMGFSMTRSPYSPQPSSLFTNLVNRIQSNPQFTHLNPQKNPPFLRCSFDPKSRKTSPRRKSPIPSLKANQPFTIGAPTVSEKVQRLDFEFKSLSEPIDRVKKLLHYATILPPCDESLRIQENRVLGCATQVWLEVEMDGNGVMGFRVDSDSEITKGFCSCLVWVLDGARPDEVLSVKTEDLVEMNVGLPSRGNSRVNAWHNVLISMQKRTKNLLEDRGKEKHQSWRCSKVFNSLES